MYHQTTQKENSQMNREIIVFNGGINNVIAGHLINDDEAQYISNAKILSGVLSTARQPTLSALPYNGDHVKYYRSEDEIVASQEDRFYVEWAGFLYWSSGQTGDKKLKRYDSTTVNDIGGHTPPLVAPTAVANGSGLLKGDYSYCYTYVYEDAFESAPSPIFELPAMDNNKVTITVPTIVGNPTHYIIYRAGGINPTFNQITKEEVANLAYEDNTDDFNISRKEITTGTNDSPPLGLDMLVELKGTLFGAVGNKVHFSREGQPEYWSTYNYVELPTAVTGLGVQGNSVIAFTEENMFLISGTSIMNIQLVKLPFAFGCKNKRTVQSIKGQLLWVSTVDEYDLICSFTGSGVEILNLSNVSITASTMLGREYYDSFTTETYDNFSFDIIGSLGIGRKYYLFTTGRTIVVDFEYGMKIYYMDETTHGAFEYHNTMYVIQDPENTGKEIYEYLKSFSKYRNLFYFSKEFSDTELTRDKAYRKISINASGKWAIDVRVGRTIVYSFSYENGQTVFLPSGIVGKTISFIFKSEGYAEIKALEYEYEPLKVGYTTIGKPALEDHHCDLSVGGDDGKAYYLNFKWNPDCTIFKK